MAAAADLFDRAIRHNASLRGPASCKNMPIKFYILRPCGGGRPPYTAEIIGNRLLPLANREESILNLGASVLLQSGQAHRRRTEYIL